jgi:hypothetical protein
MTDKNIYQQLKSLKDISLSDESRKKHKNILFSQISHTFVNDAGSAKQSLFNFKNVFSLVSQPLLVVAGIFVFLLGSLVLGSGLYANSKPNDSLYIARVISEKARLNTTFSQSNRDALALKFASDHAKDIATILMDPEFNTEENKVQVERLNASFQNEISKVRTRIEKNEGLVVATLPKAEDNNETVSSASSLKDDNGVSIHISKIKPSDGVKVDSPAKPSSVAPSVAPDAVPVKNTSSSEVDVVSLAEDVSESVEKLSGVKDGQKIISEIEQLFAEGRYDEVISKLEQVGDIVKK